MPEQDLPFRDSESLDDPQPESQRSTSLDGELFAEQVWYCKSRVEALLRGHLWIEHLLEQMLDVALVRQGVVNLNRLTWSYKLQLCNGLGLIAEDDVPALRELNRIRNRLAHDLGGEPTDADIDQLLSLSPGRLVSAIKDVRAIEEEADRIGDDRGLADLRFWTFGIVMDLTYRLETQRYEKAHQTALMRATGVKFVKDMGKDPISMEEAERQQGMPPRPQPGDFFR